MNKIFIIGAGPGTEEYLLPVALKRIRESDCLIGAQRVLDLFPDFKKKKLCFDGRLSRVVPYLKKHREDKKIALLVSGDPGLYSLAQTIAKHFKKNEYEVIPGISSLQLAFARTGESWQDVKIISLHGRKINNRALEDVKNNPKVFIFSDDNFPPGEIARFLLRGGIKNRRAVVLENLSYQNERIVDTGLAEISKMKGFGLCVMIII